MSIRLALIDSEFYNRLLNFEPNLECIPGPIQPIVQKLLVKEPAHRFQKADQVLTALAEKLSRPRLIETLAIRESYLQAARFVGREIEMEQLTQALQNAGDGIGSKLANWRRERCREVPSAPGNRDDRFGSGLRC